LPAEQFRFTTGRWYNKPREDGGYAKAPAYREGFTYDGFAYGTDTPEDYAVPADAPGGLQRSLICSRGAAFLAVDVDYPENLAGSGAGQHVSWADAISSRGAHFHAGVDMRGVSEGDWPVQGRTAWGDVKAAGFIPVPGSVHYTGQLYAAAPDWPSKVLKATPELLDALRADREAHALARLNSALAGRGLPAGTRLPDGAYLYSSGYAGGSWAHLPDGSLTHDDELKDLAWDMGVEHGLPEEEARKEWERLAGALGSPWTERDWQRHWHRVPGKRAQREDEEEWTERTFGLTGRSAPWEAARDAQQAAYEKVSRDTSAGFGPPTAPQPDGPTEDPADGVPWFQVYLGATRDAPVFDAGEPTDAGNAEAVLYRARRALRHDEEADTWLKRVAGRWVQDAEAAKEAVTALRAKLPPGCADPLKHPRYEHLDPEADAGEVAALKRHAKNYERLGTDAAVSAIARMMKNIARARPETWMTVRDSSVDADPEVLWAGGVPWDLRASAHGPVRAWHVDRSEPHLHSAACVPDASVPTPLWDALMRAVWVNARQESDPDLAWWAVLVLSAGVTGYPKKVVPLLKGGTDRGKSTVIDAVASVLGTYFRPLNEKILEAGSSTHDTVLMELKGTRLTFLDEGIQRGKVATARLKRIVGGSSITANRMRQDPVTFRPTHTLAITLNPEESFSFDDPAVDSRLRTLPCDGNPDAVIAAARPFDYFHSPAWLAERPGVLAKLMAAAAVMLSDPRSLDKDRAPASVTMAEQAARNDEDEVLRWFLEATEDCPEGYPSRELYKHFLSWTEEARSRGDRSPLPTETRWGRRMNELVPDDHPDARRLLTPRNTVLRRRRPLSPGGYQPSGGFGGFPGAQTISRPVHEAGWAPATVRDQAENFSGAPANPPDHGQPTENSPDRSTREFSSFKECSDSTDTHHHSIPSKNSTHRGLYTNRSETNPPDCKPSGNGTPGTAPAALKKDNRLENGEKASEAEKRDSPLGQKTPRKRLTDSERAERLAARKAKLAAERAEAKAAKVAELGGRAVILPAVVLRDMTIMEVTPAQARAWLDGMTELSVDVEHTGFPVGHPLHRLRLVQLGNEHSAVVLDPANPVQARIARDALEAATALHAHSAHADLIPLEHAGLCDGTAWDKMTDTLLLAKLSDPRLCDSDEHGLKSLAKALLGKDRALSWKLDELRKEVFAAGGWIGSCEMDTAVERSGWAQIPICESFIRYAGADVMDCSAVARVLG